MARLTPGNEVVWNKEKWILLDIPEVSKALLKNPTSGKAELVDVAELEISSKNKQSKELVSIPNDAWELAWQQFQILRPLIGKTKRERTYEEVNNIAKKLGKSKATVYRWLAKLNGTTNVSALLRENRSDIGNSRLEDKVESIIEQQIADFYLTRERPTISELWEQIALLCREQDIDIPSRSTIRRRVDKIQDQIIVAKRYSHKLAREKFEPIRGSFPDANIPLAVYQIDHTPIDIIFVDEQYRKPIGRAYLTIVIDTCTRMLAGFYVSFEAPSSLSAGLALSHAILPKKKWLAKFSIDTEWPIYGVPQKIYADNAAEFRGTMLERACHEYGIIMENRPKGLPNYGGHVERSFRTFMTRTHRLSGSTFSNIQEKGEYNSEKKAVMTLNEFEHWFGIFITKVYHHKKHKGIGNTPPIKLYEQFILGDENCKGIGLPPPIQDEQKLRFDFMPYLERTIQEYGVLIDNIYYYAEVLRPWIHARDPNNPKLKRKFIFTRDPRDISVVYFYDPETKDYYNIPYRNLSHPPMSLWELKTILKKLAESPELQPNESLIFEGLLEMRQVEQFAREKTKSARRNSQRRKDWNKHSSNTPKQVQKIKKLPTTSNLQPFTDIEEAE